MLRIFSSAFGDLFEKLSQASYSMADAVVDPGLKIDRVETTKY